MTCEEATISFCIIHFMIGDGRYSEMAKFFEEFEIPKL
jgi:hypothetical protein